MKNAWNVRNAALVAALAAVAATAWAMNDSYYPTTPASTTAVTTTTTLAPAEPVVAHEEGAISEAATAPAPHHAVADEGVKQPPITIEERRLSLDERIQSDVMEALLHVPHITGKIGVESKDAVVTLTGWTNTSGQAFRAGRAAEGVQGVQYVDNLIHPRVGGSI